MSDTVQQALFGVGLPIIVALLCVVPGARAACSDEGRDRFAWRLPVALALPVAIAFFALYGWPREQWQHLAFVAPAGAAVGVALALTRRTLLSRAGLYVALAALATAAIWPVIAREPLTLKLLPGATILLLGLGLEVLAISRPGPMTALAMALAAATSAAMVLTSGFMKLSIPYGALAVALAATALAGAWRDRRLSLADGAMAVAAVMLVVAPYTAWLYATSSGDPLPVWSFALPSIAPLALFLGELGAVRRRSGWLTGPLRLALVLVPCAVAVFLAFAQGEEAATEDPYADMYREMMP